MPRTEQQKRQGQTQGQSEGFRGPELKAYRLLAGQHIQADHEWEPPEDAVRQSRSGYFLDSEGEVITDPETEKPVSPPSRTYSAGEVVLSPIDLVDRFGHQKFEALSETASETVKQRLTARTRGDVTPLNEREAASRAPHGQVSTGRPETGTTDAGLTVSGSEGSPATQKVAAGVGVAPGEIPRSDDPTAQAAQGRPGTEAELKAQAEQGKQSEQKQQAQNPAQSPQSKQQAPRKSASELDRMSAASSRRLLQRSGGYSSTGRGSVAAPSR
jgi:hypothetical protein